MQIDLHQKAKELLENVANSIHERDKSATLCFNISEIRVVEEWLHDFLVELHNYADDL